MSHLSVPAPHLQPPATFCCCLHSFASSRMACTWNPIGGSHFRLTSFPWLRHFRFSPRHFVSSQLNAFHRQILLRALHVPRGTAFLVTSHFFFLLVDSGCPVSFNFPWRPGSATLYKSRHRYNYRLRHSLPSGHGGLGHCLGAEQASRMSNHAATQGPI